METQNHPRSRYAGKAALIGTALTVALVAPIAGSATLDSGSFFIYAYDDQEPEINARAGLNGLAGNPGGENPGGPGEENPTSLTGTVICEDESVTVTQAMLDFSDRNREAVASGGTAETWPGGDWEFITAGSYWQTLMGFNAGVKFDNDRIYIFSNSPDTALSDFMLFGQSPHVVEPKSQISMADYTNGHFSGAKGDQPSIIGGFSVNLDGSTLEGCDYRKFESGKISSSDDGPAYFSSSTLSDTRLEIYTKDGLPAFGPERPSYVSTNSGGTTETSYLRSNGERWDYYDATGALWHPSSTIGKSTLGETRIEWIDCFSDECSTRFDNPVVARAFMPTDQEEGLTVLNYTAPLTHGADHSTVKTDASGTVVFRTYTKKSLEGSGSHSFSRTNGPAEYYTDGNTTGLGYWIDGKAMHTQSDYEAAGGINWRR